MKKFILIVCFFPLAIFAQPTIGYLGTMNVGAAYYQEDDMSVFLPDSTATLSNYGVSWGVGVDYIVNRWLIGASFMYFSQPKTSVDTFDIKTKSNDYRLDIGYMTIVRPKFLFGPVLALGGGFDQVNLMSTENATTAQIAANPGREIHLKQNKFVADLGLQTHYRVASGGEGGGLSLGLQVGYSVSYAIADWRFEDAKISDGPEGLRPMMYARLSIGFPSLESDAGDSEPDNGGGDIYHIPN